ncbi:TIFY 4B-like protein isoform X1 [Tanacetum coccineum]
MNTGVHIHLSDIHSRTVCLPAISGVKAHLLSDMSAKDAAEGSASRKASVHRYLEKWKDRFKSKRKPESSICASLDVHLSQSQNQNGQTTRSSACSPPPIRSPNTPNRYS